MAKRAPIDVSYERIKDFCLNPDNSNLTAKEVELHLRWNFIDDQIRKYGASKECYTIISKKYPDLSRAQIMRDIALTKKLFSTTSLIDKEYYRRWLIEDIMEHIKRCKNMGDNKNVTAEHANLIKVLGLDKEDKDIDPEKLEQHNYYMVANINGMAIKLDLTEMHKVPETIKSVLLNLNEEINEETAAQLLLPNAQRS